MEIKESKKILLELSESIKRIDGNIAQIRDILSKSPYLAAANPRLEKFRLAAIIIITALLLLSVGSMFISSYSL